MTTRLWNVTRTISKTIGVPNSTGKHIKVSRMNQWRDFLDLGRSKDESWFFSIFYSKCVGSAGKSNVNVETLQACVWLQCITFRGIAKPLWLGGGCVFIESPEYAIFINYPNFIGCTNNHKCCHLWQNFPLVCLNFPLVCPNFSGF